MRNPYLLWFDFLSGLTKAADVGSTLYLRAYADAVRPYRQRYKK